MPENQKRIPHFVTTEEVIAINNQKARIERRQSLVKKFVVCATISFIVINAIRAVADADSYDDTQEETED